MIEAATEYSSFHSCEARAHTTTHITSVSFAVVPQSPTDTVSLNSPALLQNDGVINVPIPPSV